MLLFDGKSSGDAGKTLDDFVRRRPGKTLRILAEKNFTAFEVDSIEGTKASLLSKFEKIASGEAFGGTMRIEFIPNCGFADMAFFKFGSALVVASADRSTLLGGISGGTVFVLPEHRGKGVARAIHVVHAENDIDFLFPSHYSEGGYAARVSAHRLICERAHSRGEMVHAQNMEAYGLSPAPQPVTDDLSMDM